MLTLATVNSIRNTSQSEEAKNLHDRYLLFSHVGQRATHVKCIIENVFDLSVWRNKHRTVCFMIDWN